MLADVCADDWRPATPKQRLLAERAHELELEAELAEQRGRAPPSPSWRSQRFPLPADDATPRCQPGASHCCAPTGTRRRAAANLARQRRRARSGQPVVGALAAACRRSAWPVRIEVVPGLVSLAAVADGVVRVRAGARLSAERRASASRCTRSKVTCARGWRGQRLGGVFVGRHARARPRTKRVAPSCSRSARACSTSSAARELGAALPGRRERARRRRALGDGRRPRASAERRCRAARRACESRASRRRPGSRAHLPGGLCARRRARSRHGPSSSAS